MGRGYAIEHCVSALKLQEEEKAYKYYITDALKAIVENTANMAGGKIMSQRFYDLINVKTVKEETRSSEDVINHIIDKIAEVRGNEDESV